MLAMYVMSFGPACWIAGHSGSSQVCTMVSVFYRPVAASIICGPDWYQVPMRQNIRMGLPRSVTLLDDPGGIYLSFPGFTYTILGL